VDDLVLRLLKESEARFSAAREALKTSAIPNSKEASKLHKVDSIKEESPKKETPETNEIYEALLNVSEPLARSYRQAKHDLDDLQRESWSGTAHEIREIVATLLRTLAPDEEVIAQKNYKQDKETSGPTQKQRVIYILQQHNAGSKEQALVASVAKMDDLIADIVRGFYSRASDAAHTGKDRRETKRLLTYFEAFARDLLNLG
jgi:hypothetical protein